MIFKFISRKIKFLLHAAKQKESDVEKEEPEKKEITKDSVKKQLSSNVSNLKKRLSNSSDLKIHYFRTGKDGCYTGALAFIDGLVSNTLITESILRPLTVWEAQSEQEPDEEKLMDGVIEQALCSGEIEKILELPQAVAGCLSGDTVLFMEGCASALVISTKGWDKRSVSEPQSETVVRGPREGFTENLRTNTSLIRRKIKSGKLHVENMKIGRKTQTDICLMYLEDVVSSDVIRTVKSRMKQLDVDAILESGYIEEYIEDAPLSPFPTVGYTEKPDVAAGKILEGRIAIIVDGTPFVLTAPMLFVESFQTTEDYYTRTIYASLMRVTRFIGYLITIFAPGIYISLSDFHQEIIPTTLLFTIANAREGTPFPVFVETLIMVFAFEIIREAGIRLPRPVGQAISIVGALVMGDAAVSAGLVGAPVVIVVAITAVSAFLVPSQSDSVSMLRVAMMALASFTGWYGLAMGSLAILLYLGSLTSFGVPYFDGFSWNHNLQDSLVRMPLWTMVKRPKYIAEGNITRIGKIDPPLRPHKKEEGEDEDL
ncbi:spore germination protein [Scatolibacter rhodanostii]|uniref:spore germination protein n=1 Tax=Scatolibacter rhodanostii TaxID=2014781 RepID=UPI000C07BCDD|nr:spore germination protein [Scatolibacter rhodanostii]